jgi:hypothetical protein
VVFWSRLALLAMAYPAFALLNAEPTLERLLTVTACLAVPMAMTAASTLVLVSEVLPQRLRATGLSVSYYAAVGVSPSSSRHSLSISPGMPVHAFYVIGCGLLSLVGLAMVQETLRKRLS